MQFSIASNTKDKMKTKIVYNITDASETIAFESPLEHGHFLMPAGSTDVNPSAFNSETETCIFNGSEWVVSAIPEPEPEPKITFEQKKEIKSIEINSDCSRAIRAGFVSNALGSDHHYSTSENEDQINLTGAVALGADVYYSCTDTATNKKQMRLHTHAQIKKVLSDGASEKTKLMQRYYDKVELVNAATTVEEIEAIVWGDK